jgi:DNA (cytosine-5)-methyltransferase 1
MKFLSLFSGIGGFDLGFERAGMECASVCEIDKQAQAVLRRHFPNAKLFDDVRKVGIATHERYSIDLVCGGFPCQDLSIAGRREGLAGKRSGLWFEFARVVDELEPQWIVVENVPGLLSSNRGRDFAIIVQWLAERGYGVAWRALDAQYFGVPQRRRRVFIVASLGDGRAAEILFERGGGARDPSSSGKEGQEVADLSGKSAPLSDKQDDSVMLSFNWQSGGDMRLSVSDKPMLQSCQTPAITAFLGGQGSKARSVAAHETLSPTLKGVGGGNQVPMLAGALQSHSKKHGHAVTTQQAAENNQLLVWDRAQITSKEHGSKPSEISQPLNTLSGMMVGVRRLTPTECERLQGFPDGWTDGQSDSARYRQLGNAVAVPVAEWIGRRIVKANKQRRNQ